LKLDPTHCLDHARKVSVAVIGAGLSGINAGILLPAKVPGIELTIFEKNNDVVSACDSHEMGELTIYRAARGLKMSIPECDATFQLMYTKRHTHPTRNGLRSLREALKFATIGRRRLGSTMFTNMSNFSIALTKQSGMMRSPNGG
jgi:hypothetical protein